MIPNKPIWDDTHSPMDFSALKKNLQTDICVIGAGITGLSVAYMLSKQGKKVVVVDKGEVGFGETGVTTAHLTYVLDNRYFELEKLHGKDATKLVLESHTQAIDLIEDIAKKEKIDCDFERVNGYLFLGQHGDEKILDLELRSLHSLGFTGVSKETKAVNDGIDMGSYLQFPDQAQIHPLKYLLGLAKCIQKNGGEIYKNSFVQNVKEDKNGVHISVEGGLEIKSSIVVVATNSPFNDRFEMHTKQAAYRTYALAVEIPKDSVEQALYWDTEAPYHYIRLYKPTDSAFSLNDFLIIGGEDHKTGQGDNEEDLYKKILVWAKKNFPMIKGAMKYRWSGQILEPIDGIAFIGLNPHDKRTYITTGYSGSGMTYGPMAGKIISDLILGKENEFTDLYNPTRKDIKAAGTFMKENLNVARQYADILLPQEDIDHLKTLKSEEGIVVNKGLQKIAAYKNKDGKVCKYSAICPHLGCVVRWNKDAQSFDCPCHGSRFDTEGKVLNGPAKENLKQLLE